MTTRRALLPRVLILSERAAVALAACRALGRAGYQVGVAGWRPLDEAGVSRYAARYHRVPVLEHEAHAWTLAVRQLVADHHYDVVVAITDAALARIMDLQLPVPTTPRLSQRHHALMDKGLLAELCTRASVRYPSTDRPTGAEEDAAAAHRVLRPMIVKAALPAAVIADRVVTLPGARLVTDPDRTLQALAGIRREGADPIVQEYISGPKLQAVIIRRSAVTSCRLAYRVQREFPLRFGSEAMLEAVETEAGIGGEMVPMLERLADAAGYEGLLQAEFIEDPEGKSPYLIDANPRLWGSLQFAEGLGFRMTERVIRDALSLEPLPPPPNAVGRRYHHLTHEWRWLRAQRRIPAGYIATYSWRDVWDGISLTDPRPELLRLTRAMRGGGLPLQPVRLG